MKSALFAILSLIVVSSTFLFAQENPIVTVDNIEICNAVEDRQPVGADTSFTVDVGQLYCFTNLSSDQDTTAISHVWYYGDKEMARVELTMKAQTWRTWSSKNIASDWTGEWRVDVLSPGGQVLASKKFVVKAAAN